MKVISRRAAISLLILAGAPAYGGEQPTISGAWTELRKAPVFGAETLPLAKTWGPSLPLGNAFEVEKVYGRWVYGRPAPLKNMKAADFSPSGWVFGRMLLMPGDSDTLTPPQVRLTHAVLYHARAAGKKLGLCKEQPCSSMDFLESLTLSQRTLEAFSSQNDGPGNAMSLPFLPQAFADEEDKDAPMGLAGTDLTFLEKEVLQEQSKKQKAEHKRVSLHLRPPKAPALDEQARTALLGRFMLQRYLDLPPLTMEEVDGHLYMRATALRALQGCSKEVRAFWKGRRWNYFRVFGLKSRPEDRHPWFEVALPGGYFALSGRAIELAGNEAELAFLLVRPLVRELHMKHEKRKAPKLGGTWPESLQTGSEELWDQVLRAQSTKDAENLDVADEIAVDLQAAECISQAGYRPLAGVAYLRKLALNRDAAWAGWVNKHTIGLDYRIERGLALVQEALAKQKFREGTASNTKRFANAARIWNLLP